jgi:cytochrome P450
MAMIVHCIFGAGARFCVGKELAVGFVSLYLATL